MIIDSPNQLREWLTGYLPPLCDADPEVLAKYCLALVKKDRPNDELKTSLIAQLDVFLKTNTESFVEKFLEVARSKSYMKDNRGSSPTKSLTKGEEPVKEETSPMSVDNTTTKTDANVPEKAKETSPQPPLPPLPPPVHAIPYPPPETTPPYPPPKKEDAQPPAKVRKSEPKERDREERRSRRNSRSRENKTRSRSRDRGDRRRSRSRGRSTRSKYDDRRRWSPHSRGPLKRYSRRSRSRTRSPRWSRSPARRSRSRDRRSRSRNNRSRSLTPPKRHHSQRKTRSRSPKIAALNESPPRKSPIKEEKEGSASPEANASDAPSAPPPIVHSVVSIPNQDRYTISKSQRCRDYDEQGFCMRGDQCPYDHGADPVVLEGGALDFPPPLAGVPPVSGYPPISAGPSLPREMSGRGGGGFLRHPPPPPRPAQFGEYTPSNPGLWGSDGMPSSATYYGNRGRGIGGPPPRFPGPPPPLAPQDMGRELISVPVNGSNQGKSGIRSSLAQRLGPVSTSSFPSNGSFPGGQASHPATKYSNTSENCTLELRKIPSGMNTIAHLNQHFAKFGTIINIQVHHDGDPEAALVTFSSHSEANAAYRSTEAVLNNRFIKLFWHNSSKSEVPSSTTNLRSVHDRLGMRNPNKSLNNKVQTVEAVSSENEKVIISRGSLVKTVFNPSAIKNTPTVVTEDEEMPTQTADDVVVPQEKESSDIRNPPPKVAAPDSTQQQMTTVDIKKKEIEKILKQQEELKAEILAKQKVEQQKADALKLKNEVENRTKQLLKEQMQHVKLLINKLEKNKSTMKPDEIKVLLNTIKSLQSAVETTKAQLASSTTPPAPKTPAKPKTKAQLEKEILDTELELYTLQSEGGDVSRIRVRLQQLKAQMVQFKATKHSKAFPHSIQRPALVPKHMRGRGAAMRGRGRGRGRPYGPGGFSAVDRRSTCLNASGFEREDKVEVLSHFASLGNVSTYSWDKLTPAITVQYATRRDAEKAMSEGRYLGDRLLTLTWVSEASAGFTSPQPVATTPTTPTNGTTLQKSSVSSSSALPPHSTATSSVSQEEEEEITEEIVEEEVETEEIGSYIYEDEVEEEDEGEEEEEEGGRSWRR